MAKKLTYSDFVKGLKGGDVQPVYFFGGEEIFLHRQAGEDLKREIVPEGAEDFDFEALDGSEFNYERFINALRSLPLMSARRLVLLKRANEVDNRKLELVVEELKRGTRGITAAFFYEKKPDMRTKAMQEFRDKFTFVELSPPKGTEFANIVKVLAGRRRLSGQVIAFLADSGADLFQIKGWLDQAACFFDDDEAELTLEHLQKFVDLGGSITIWNLSDAVGNRRKEKAQRLLMDFLHINREKPVTVIWLLKSLFFDMYPVSQVKARKASVGKYITAEVMKPFRLKILTRQSDNYSPQQIKAALQKIQRTDEALKTSRGEAESLLIELVDDIIGDRQTKSEETY